MPRFSVVVIAYNAASCIEACLASIAAQSFQDFDVVVVDDCSTDDTPRIIESAIKDDARFRLVRHDSNRKAHLARKTGVEQTTGDYVLLLDSDDTFNPHLMERLAAVYERRTLDILRFGTTVVGAAESDPATLSAVQKVYNADTGLREGDDILPSVFSDAHQGEVRGTWRVTDCCFRGDVARDGFAVMTDRMLGRMQDSYEFFVLADRARSMDTEIDIRGLRYSLGTGVSGTGMQTAGKFDDGQRGIHTSCQAIMDYAALVGGPVQRRCASWMKSTILGIVSREWTSRLTLEDQRVVFPSLKDTWKDDTADIVLRALVPLEEKILDGAPDAKYLDVIDVITMRRWFLGQVTHGLMGDVQLLQRYESVESRLTAWETNTARDALMQVKKHERATGRERIAAGIQASAERRVVIEREKRTLSEFLAMEKSDAKAKVKGAFASRAPHLFAAMSRCWHIAKSANGRAHQMVSAVIL